MRQRGQFAGTSQLPGYPAQGGDAFLRFELVSHCPAREFLRETHAASEGKVTDFDDHTVNQEVQRGPLLLNLPNARFQLRLRMRRAQIRAYLETVLPQEVQHFWLGAVRRILNGANLVKEHIQLSGCRHCRVKVSQCPSSGVAGIFQRLSRSLVVRLQCAQAHDAFALYLQQSLVGNRQRHGADGSGLGQNRLTGDTVAPGSRLHQFAIVIGQVQGQTIKFILHIILQIRLACQFLCAANPIFQCADGLYLVHAPQPMEMGMLLEALQRLSAYPMGRGLRQHHAGFLFQFDQLIIELIPLHVGNFRFVQHIIGIGRFVQPVYQCLHLRFKRIHSSSPSFTMGAIDSENSFTP